MRLSRWSGHLAATSDSSVLKTNEKISASGILCRRRESGIFKYKSY